MMKPIVRKFVAILFAIAMPVIADAQESVFDPINFIENTMTAAQTLEAEINQYTQVAYQLQSLENQLAMAKNLGSMSPSQALAEINQLTTEANNVNHLVSVDTQLYGTLGSQQQFLSQINAWASFTGNSPNQWLSNQQLLYSTGNQQAANNMNMAGSMQQHIQTLATQRQQIQTNLASSPSQLSAQQLLGQELDVVAGEQADMVTMMSAQTKTAATKQSQDLAAQQAATTQYQNNNSAAAAEKPGLDSAIASPINGAN